ncbi:MAG: trypsin-like peptidase domain-containing protein [Planctomycetota bacterium]
MLTYAALQGDDPVKTFFPVVTLLGLAISIPIVHEWVINRQQRRRVTDESQILSLKKQLEDARESLTSLNRIAESAPAQQAKIRELEQSLAGVGTRLASFDTRVDSSLEALTELKQKTTVIETKTRENVLIDATKVVEAAQKDVKNRLDSVEGRWQEGMKRLEGLEALTKEERNLEAMRREMLDPIVQLNGDDTVGSGVLLSSQKSAEGKVTTIIVSSYHVVRNILAEATEGAKDKGIRISIFVEGKPVQEVGDMIAHDEECDLVLLKLRGDRTYQNCATLLPKERVSRVTVFSPIYAVGCPLGNDPIPTNGEIASLSNVISNRNYWMINAPTYFGNSGGGIFLAKTHELVGVFSKIYTHGSGRPTVIPHMGLATPADAVADFLQKNGYGYIVKSAANVANANANEKR